MKSHPVTDYRHKTWHRTPSQYTDTWPDTPPCHSIQTQDMTLHPITVYRQRKWHPSHHSIQIQDMTPQPFTSYRHIRLTCYCAFMLNTNRMPQLLIFKDRGWPINTSPNSHQLWTFWPLSCDGGRSDHSAVTVDVLTTQLWRWTFWPLSCDGGRSDHSAVTVDVLTTQLWRWTFWPLSCRTTQLPQWLASSVIVKLKCHLRGQVHWSQLRIRAIFTQTYNKYTDRLLQE